MGRRGGMRGGQDVNPDKEMVDSGLSNKKKVEEKKEEKEERNALQRDVLGRRRRWRLKEKEAAEE